MTIGGAAAPRTRRGGRLAQGQPPRRAPRGGPPRRCAPVTAGGVTGVPSVDGLEVVLVHPVRDLLPEPAGFDVRLSEVKAHVDTGVDAVPQHRRESPEAHAGPGRRTGEGEPDPMTAEERVRRVQEAAGETVVARGV